MYKVAEACLLFLLRFRVYGGEATIVGSGHRNVLFIVEDFCSLAHRVCSVFRV